MTYKKVSLNLIIVSIIFFFISCNSRSKQEKEADQHLQEIEQLIQQNELNAAKITIDSFHAKYPRLVAKRRIAEAYKDTITRRECRKTIAYCDSLLPIKEREADSLLQYFRLEKNPKYQEIGNYVYKTQSTEANANRTYLKAYVDENADYYLISQYVGPKIEHNSVEISNGEVFAHTDTIDISSPFYLSFSDETGRWEIVTFKNEAENGVSAFVSQYINEPLKVTLHGRKNYSYFLQNADKKAIMET
ncbi:MAG TPA: hypothetical protein PK860_05595, partial [Paludibacteraceae bacterium]|nr:hypothetical protein [Paludibacteraceae bacterium]HPO67314.1 hypothetical protein [Paludibacteraceae bacterium]